MQLLCFVATFRPFPSCLKPLFQSEAKYKATDIKIFFYSHPNTTHFHKKGIVLGLLLKKRILGTLSLRACLHGGGGPQVGEVTRLGRVPYLSI